MLSQKKIDLAVLYKLYLLCEGKDEPPTQDEIRRSFGSYEVANRRVEIALEELDAKGLAEFFKNADYGYYCWSLTRDGYDVVDRALKAPNSFIARIAANGDAWLNDVEAEKAVLKTIYRDSNAMTNADNLSGSEQEQSKVDAPAAQPMVTIHNSYAPSNMSSSYSGSSEGPPDDKTSVMRGWLNIAIALLVGVGGILATLYAAGKF